MKLMWRKNLGKMRNREGRSCPILNKSSSSFPWRPARGSLTMGWTVSSYLSLTCRSYVNFFSNSDNLPHQIIWKNLHKRCKILLQLMTMLMKYFCVESWGCEHNILSCLQVRMLRLWSDRSCSGGLLCWKISNNSLGWNSLLHRTGNPGIRSCGQWSWGYWRVQKYVSLQQSSCR